MRIKLDENLSRHLKPLLTALGLDADTVGDEGLLSHSDVEVAAAAKGGSRMLFTLDLDFSDIRRFPPGSHPGIVLFRPNSFGPATVRQFVEDFVRTTDFSALKGCLVVVEDNRVRVRSPELATDTDWENIPT